MENAIFSGYAQSGIASIAGLRLNNGKVWNINITIFFLFIEANYINVK